MAGAFDGLMSDSGDALESQIRAKWGKSGDWGAQGVDRVAELAKLLRANGVTDLSKLGFANGKYEESFGGYDQGESGYVPSGTRTVDGRQLTYGGRNFGFLGDVNDDGSTSRVGERQYVGQGTPDPRDVGWSAAGHGNVQYQLVDGPDGPMIVPKWNSSSDAQDVRQAAIAAAITMGGGYLAAGGLGAGAAGAAGNGAFLGEGVASGIGAWDTAAGLGAAGSGAGGSALGAAGNGAFLGEGVSSGVGAWDTAAGIKAAGLTPAAGGGFWDSAGNFVKDIGTGLKSVGISGGDLLRTGAAFALSKNVSNPTADPNLTTAITGLDKTANDANARAQANDEYWRTTFAPRYLRAMDDQLALGKQQSDFNMGLAKKYDARYWQQMGDLDSRVNAYDSDAARARFAGEAGANSDMQSAAAMQALVRDMNRRGMNPNSGVVVSNMRQQAQQGALQKTLAMNMAREAARKEGFNMRLVTAGLGNPTGASTGFSSLANQSAGIGMNGIQGANSGFNSNVGNWNATTGVGIGAMNSVGNWGMGLTNGNSRANEMNTQGWNQMLGYGLGMFGSGRGG